MLKREIRCIISFRVRIFGWLNLIAIPSLFAPRHLFKDLFAINITAKHSPLQIDSEVAFQSPSLHFRIMDDRYCNSLSAGRLCEFCRNWNVKKCLKTARRSSSVSDFRCLLTASTFVPRIRAISLRRASTSAVNGTGLPFPGFFGLMVGGANCLGGKSLFIRNLPSTARRSHHIPHVF